MKKFFAKLKEKLNSLGRKKLLAIILTVTVCLTGLGAGLGITYAKYHNRRVSDSSASAKNFYFNSNILTTNGEDYDIYSDRISFDLMNYNGELQTSAVDIAYNVTLTSSDGGAIPAGTNTSGTITASSNNKVTVTYTGLTPGKTYTVTAKATSPYTKTISATYRIVDGDYRISHTVEDRGDYVLFTFLTDDYIGNVNLTWQNGYVPDNSVPILATATGTSHTTTISHKSVYSLKFYKTDMNASFNASAFTVSATN